jgi:DNA-binding Xre family transcriptional regulator
MIKECARMVINYNKLWKLLIDRRMTKTDLRRISGISTASVAKLGRGDNITTDVLLKICKALDCEINDIMELDKNMEE